MKSLRYLGAIAVIALVWTWLVGPATLAAQPAANNLYIEPEPYVVLFNDPPLAAYEGGLRGLDPGARDSQNRLDVQSTESRAYMDHLQSRQTTALRGIEARLGRRLEIRYRYEVVLNGLATNLTQSEARELEADPEVKKVLKDRLRYPQTDNGPAWIGADDAWNGISGIGSTKGEGMVVGVIDTGINPSNPSFADVGGDGYNHTNPRGRYYGVCNPSDPSYDPTFPCNDKLIGAYDFVENPGYTPSPIDHNSHGSHTASTAAGNRVNATLTAATTSITRTISGVAPHANIIAYKGIDTDSGMSSWLVAAIEQATKDKVDVINYSIGGSEMDPWNDIDSLAFLNARKAGIFVAVSAGNLGPLSGSIGSPANSPWVNSVGNSSHDRRFPNSVTSLTRDGGTPLANITGVGLTSGLSARSIVYAGDFGGITFSSLCGSPFPAGTFSGQIVVCDRGGGFDRIDKGANVLAGGAGGMILANDAMNGDSIVADGHVLPAVHITYNDGVALKNWLTSGTNHQAAISGATTSINSAYGDIMSSSSSRGPNDPAPNVIKPDVSAPGTDILAAGGTGDPSPAVWVLKGGTSMASPHIAGAAALIRKLHPDWTPAEVQSAFTLTAKTPIYTDGIGTAGNCFDGGGGMARIGDTAKAGFVLDENYNNYLAADPAAAGHPEELNLATLGQARAVDSHTWQRTITSTLATTVQWTASTSGGSGLNLSVNPSVFNLTPGQSRTIAITADVTGAAFDTWLFGSVTLTPNSPSVPAATFPVAVKRTVANIPEQLIFRSVPRTGSRTLTNIKGPAISQFSSVRYGMAPATLYTTTELYQEVDPGGLANAYILQETIGSGIKRLVIETVETTAVDLNLYIFNSSQSLPIASSVNGQKNERVSLIDPPADTYYYAIQNRRSSDPSGATPDSCTVAVAHVTGDQTNIDVSLASGGTSVPASQPFNVSLDWSLASDSDHYYGYIALGTSAATPSNIGIFPLDLHIGGSVIAPLIMLLNGY